MIHANIFIKLTDFLPNPSYILRSVGFLLHRDIRIRRDGFHPVTFPPTLGRIDHRLGFEPRRNPVISSYLYVYSEREREKDRERGKKEKNGQG
jgi:hypothetical protein